MNRRLVLAMTAIAAVVAIALSVPTVLLVTSAARAALVDELRVETLTTASLLSSLDRAQWAEAISKARSRPEERIVVVDDRFQLIADTELSDLERTFDRPEILAALDGTLASSVRSSKTLGQDLRYVAAPIVQGERIVAAVRFSLPEEAVLSAVRRTAFALGGFTLAVMLCAALIALLISRTISEPVLSLARMARKLSTDLSVRADPNIGPHEVREVAEALNATAQRLQQIVLRSERVAADASHHLRTPLTGIRLRLEAISDITESSEVGDQAEHAISEVDRLNRRIDQVLALARADAGASNQRLVHISEVVSERIAHFSTIANRCGLSVETDLQLNCVVLTEPGAVPRIVDELLGNAQQYAKHLISVRLWSADDKVHLLVSDDGPGVPEQERESVFERFSRGKQAAPGGTGLGLALVRETAVANGGNAWAEPSCIGGFAAHVVFPAAESFQTL